MSTEEHFASYHMNLGIQYATRGWYDRAIEEFRSVLNADPQNGLAYYNMGNAYKDCGQFENAIRTYEHALELGCAMGDLYNNMGICQMRCQKPEEAQETWAQGLRADPHHHLLRENLQNARS